jgi:TM2 domain-containing membrane protein YozV
MAIVMERENFVVSKRLPDPGVAAVLSFILPGLGQFYNGCFFRGILWLFVGGVTWIWSAGFLGWVIHIFAAWAAYSYAKRAR